MCVNMPVTKPQEGFSSVLEGQRQPSRNGRAAGSGAGRPSLVASQPRGVLALGHLRTRGHRRRSAGVTYRPRCRAEEEKSLGNSDLLKVMDWSVLRPGWSLPPSLPE